MNQSSLTIYTYNGAVEVLWIGWQLAHVTEVELIH